MGSPFPMRSMWQCTWPRAGETSAKLSLINPKHKTSLPHPAPARPVPCCETALSSAGRVKQPVIRCRAVMTAIPAQESLLLGGRTASSQVALLHWPLKAEDIPRLPLSHPLGLGREFTQSIHRLFFLNSSPASLVGKENLPCFLVY